MATASTRPSFMHYLRLKDGANLFLQYDLDGTFTDIMELAFYNAVLTAMSVHGTSYTYVNQLASSDKNPAQRQDWFKCTCNPDPGVTVPRIVHR